MKHPDRDPEPDLDLDPDLDPDLDRDPGASTLGTGVHIPTYSPMSSLIVVGHWRPPLYTVGGMFRRRFCTEFASRAHSANYYVVYPGDTPENHPRTKACMIGAEFTTLGPVASIRLKKILGVPAGATG